MSQLAGLCLFLLFTTWVVEASSLLEDEPKYIELNKIGDGSWGVVYRVDDHVIKVAECGIEPDDLQTVLEIAVLKSLPHKSIPKIIDVQLHKGLHNTYWEVKLPYYNKLNFNNSYDIIKDLASVLTYAHEKNIVHRDIKKRHILEADGTAVLIDWGSADIFPADPIRSQRTTANYRDPATLLNNFSYPKDSDMWSLGVSLYELTFNNGESIFAKSEDETILWQDIFIGDLPKSYKSSLSQMKKNKIQFSPKSIKIINEQYPVENKFLFKYLLDADSKTRITASNLKILLGDKNIEESKELAPPPKLFVKSEKQAITGETREQIYLWLHHLYIVNNHRPKIFFEAMSIADSFLSTSSLARNRPILAAYAAYYLACAFYELKESYTSIIREIDETFTTLDFQTFLLGLIQDANYELIFNHTLREYQATIYNVMSSQSRKKIIALLAMLEMHKNTFKLSNASKWKIALAFLYDNMSKEYAQIINGICQDFKEEDFFSFYYIDLCEGHLRRFPIN